MIYYIKVTSKERTENYRFEEPEDGNIENEIETLLEELKAGNIEEFNVGR